MQRNNYEVGQEFIVNGLLITLNKKDKVYFERIEDFQIFYKYWRQDADLTIEQCLKLMNDERLKLISLAE